MPPNYTEDCFYLPNNLIRVETTVKLTKAEIPEPEKWQLIDSINSVTREYMHGVVFLVLGLLVQNAVTQSGAKGG